MGGLLLLQPQAQRLADRLGPRQAALAAEGIELIALALGQFDDGAHGDSLW
jgi:hypothetical protein